jgi:REP element-mobilizing transposase RayT
MAGQASFDFPLGWGGARVGAGRKRAAGARAGVPHRARPRHDRRTPAHVTMRACSGLPSFRAPWMFAVIRGALAAGSKADFRLVHFSVQGDHLHLIVEADDGAALSAGVKGLAIRTALAVNREVQRKGAVSGDRYHVHALTTPTETRRALLYVLFNFRKHRPGERREVDPCSSAAWFDGFREGVPGMSTASPVRGARMWLARVGWRRAGGPISVAEGPRPT